MKKAMAKKAAAKPPKANPKAPLGAGGRFAALQQSIQNKSGYSADRAGAIAAAIGRRKYGKAKFQALAAKGRKAG